MFKAYKLKLDEIRKVVAPFTDSGKQQSKLIGNSIKNGLQKYLDVNCVLNGEEIIKDWFPEVKADIFISHSHRDDSDVHGLAGWLYKKFGLVSFVDADIWGYCNDLIKQLDDAFSLKPNGLYDYRKTRETSAHVHMMLVSALVKMINKTECLFFLDSDHSITARDSVLKTSSPWIYNELLISSMIRPQVIGRKQIRIQDNKFLFEQRNYTSLEMRIEYPVVYQHMKNITGPDLADWLGLMKKYGHQPLTSYHEFPLDVLYYIKE